MEKGLLALILHAHLPYVRHPEHEYFMEENWLFEAISETYLPLIRIFERFEHDGIPMRLTMTVTPTLASMLMDPHLQERYVRHVKLLIRLCEKEIERTRFQNEYQDLARFYFEHMTYCLETFEDRYGRNILTALKGFQDRERLEIITCGATHAFFPVQRSSSMVRAQIMTAAEHYDNIFGRRPIGIWLPECGYYPGVDQLLKDAGLRYFITDTHGILHASPRPKYGVFAPIYCPSGVAAFGRDSQSSQQVWSAAEGYPGDYDYREFYRDVGFDLDLEYLRPFLPPDGTRVNLGIKYHRITGRPDKEPYNRARALAKAEEHAGNFMFNRERQADHLHGFMGRKPVMVAPYDAELFGHWWYEGPEFIDFLIRKIAGYSSSLRLAAPSDVLREYPVNQASEPSFSSWGWKGYAETWLSGVNDWIYPHLHKATMRMEELSGRFSAADGLARRALKQAARELFLAASSDWAFIMHTGTVVPYARERTRRHLINFTEIYEGLTSGTLCEDKLREQENKNPVFPDIQPEIFAGR